MDPKSQERVKTFPEAQGQYGTHLAGPGTDFLDESSHLTGSSMKDRSLKGALDLGI